MSPTVGTVGRMYILKTGDVDQNPPIAQVYLAPGSTRDHIFLMISSKISHETSHVVGVGRIDAQQV